MACPRTHQSLDGQIKWEDRKGLKIAIFDTVITIQSGFA